MSAARYHRQSILPFVGEAGQAALARAHGVIVGVGALGCVSADLLARAGVGTITLIDRDVVELTNLQRQSLFTEADAGEGLPKAEAGARRLSAVNSSITIRPMIADLTSRNAEALVGGAHAILDATDNYETRYILNDLAVKRSLAFFYAGAVGAEAMVAPILAHRAESACLRCLFPEPPAPESRRTCDTAGVFGPAVGAIGALQAGEALKFLMGREDLIEPALTRLDLARNTLTRAPIGVAKDPACPCCAARRFDWLEGELAPPAAAALCGRNAVQVPASAPHGAVDFAALESKLRPSADVVRTKFLLRARLREEQLEITVFGDGRAVVAGTTDPARARAAVARFIGS